MSTHVPQMHLYARPQNIHVHMHGSYLLYRIAGNFRGVLNFVIFVVHYEVAKISTHELFSVLRAYAHAQPPWGQSAEKRLLSVVQTVIRSSRRFSGGTINKLKISSAV